MPKETFSGFSPEEEKKQEEREKFEEEIVKKSEIQPEIDTFDTSAFKDDLSEFVKVCIEQGYLKTQEGVDRFAEILREAKKLDSEGAKSFKIRGLIQDRTEKEIGTSIDLYNFSMDLRAFKHIKKKAYKLLEDLI